VAALVFVLMVAVVMNMLMAVDYGFMAVLMAVVHVGLGPMAVLVFMLVVAVATHPGSPPFPHTHIVNSLNLASADVKKPQVAKIAPKIVSVRLPRKKSLTAFFVCHKLGKTPGTDPESPRTTDLKKRATKAWAPQALSFRGFFCSSGSSPGRGEGSLTQGANQA
jgi:hypothetical protein